MLTWAAARPAGHKSKKILESQGSCQCTPVDACEDEDADDDYNDDNDDEDGKK